MDAVDPVDPVGAALNLLFHGTSRRLDGDYLEPSIRTGDVGDPTFPVVFASDRLDFAAMFAAKNEAVSHISAGSTPYLLVVDRGAHERAPPGGSVVVTESGGFSPLTIDGEETGKWYSERPVPIDPGRIIPIDGLAHLLSLGVAVLYLDGPRDWARATRVAAALERPRPDQDFAATLADLVRAGDLDDFELLGSDRSPAEQTDRYFDQVVAPRMALRTRVRLIHGMDHACRTAALCRLLHNLLVRTSVIGPFSPRDLAALMVTAVFHDAGRRRDTGADDSVAESGAAAAAVLRDLGYSAEEARLGSARVRGEGAREAGEVEVGAAILQSADALELMRNYIGDIRLAATPVYRLLRGADPAAVEAYAALARSYGLWLRSIGAWGLGAGRVLGPNGRVEAVSPGPIFDPVGVFRRNLSSRPFAETRAMLDRVKELSAVP